MCHSWDYLPSPNDRVLVPYRSLASPQISDNDDDDRMKTIKYMPTDPLSRRSSNWVIFSYNRVGLLLNAFCGAMEKSESLCPISELCEGNFVTELRLTLKSNVTLH